MRRSSSASAPRMPAWRRWQRRGRRPAWRAHAGRLHPLQPALVGDLWHGYGRYQTAADPLVPRDASIELGRRLGVSYPTAWYLHKRLRHAMTERGARHVLGAAPADGCARPTVEADDGYLGGEHNQGRGTAGKTRVIAACERQADGAMGYVVMKVVASFTAEHVAAFRDAHIAHGAHIHTDGLRGFPAFADPATQRTHQVTVTASKRPDRARGSAFFWINTAIANLSTAIKATYKAPSPKHLPDYLGAFCWTTNHRKNMRGMISAACRAIATSTALTRNRLCTACRGDWLIGGFP